MQRLNAARMLSLACMTALTLFFAACGSGTVTVTAPTKVASPTPVPLPTLSLVTQSQTGTDATAADLGATATCPAGKVLVGGGYDLHLTSDTQMVSIRTNYPSAPNAWTATASNPQSGGTMTITAYATCLTATFTVTTTIVNAPSASDGTGSATCPTGTTLIGGGFKQEIDQSNVIPNSYPTTSGWKVTQFGEIHGAYTIYAICANSALALATISTGTASIANGATGEADASCSAGQLLIGGGYSSTGGAVFTGKDIRLADALTPWMDKVYNLYAPSMPGPGGSPPPPGPLQVTAYGICVKPTPTGA